MFSWQDPNIQQTERAYFWQEKPENRKTVKKNRSIKRKMLSIIEYSRG